MTATRAARGRNALSYADRDRLAASGPPLPETFLALFGATVLHHFREMTTGIGASQCAACFGWVDDWRHA